MKKLVSSVPFVALGAVLVMIGNTAALRAAEPDKSVQKAFQKLLAAVQSKNRDAFVADATDAVKQAITQQGLDDLYKELGSRLKKGYEATYLCQLKQSGVKVHLWKMTFKDGDDDVLVRLALENGKVAGFFLQ
jgi:hypothetical protein